MYFEIVPCEEGGFIVFNGNTLANRHDFPDKRWVATDHLQLGQLSTSAQRLIGPCAQAVGTAVMVLVAARFGNRA